MTAKDHEPDRFKELTWEDIEDWAGSRALSRGKNYQRQVSELAATPAGGLIAFVQGGKKYTTLVYFQDGDLGSQCTCPYGVSCKHAVAVVLEYLNRAKKGGKIPALDDEDARLHVFKSNVDYDLDDDDYPEEEVDDHHMSSGPGRNAGPAGLKGYLEKLTKDELIGFLLEEAGKHPPVLEDLMHMEKLSKGDVKKIVADVRREILSLSAEPAWRNHWNNEGHIPDYSQVRNRLESLLSAGHADAVIALEKELLTAGIEQVEMSHDEGETGMEISSCLEVVFSALPESSLSPVEQIVWAINAELKDDYELCEGSREFWEIEREASHWSAVADELQERLKHFKPSGKEDEFSRNYARDALCNWVIMALEKAGRQKEVVSLCEEEAVKTGSYARLVNVLLKEGRQDEAEQWILKGVKASSGQYPGIAAELVDTLREIREKENNWPAVAAIRAAEFLRRPDSAAYDKLRQSSERAGVWPSVREAILLFLETGKTPYSFDSWPLPEPEVKIEGPSHPNKLPMTHTLIEIAIDEKRPDEIIKWYDSQPQKQGHFRQCSEHMENRIAHGVEDAYPDRAAAIWKGLAENQIALTKPAAYGVASGYLKKIRELLIRLHRGEEWTRYLTGLRHTNARKPRFIETLARMEGQKIIDEKG